MSTLSNSLLSGLTQSANRLVARMKNKVSQNGLPQAISNAMSIEPAVATESGGSIDIVIDLNEDSGAPMAAAYEWGSGLHSTKYSPQLIPIPQRKPGPLHFYWENRGKWFYGAKLPFGHPGVAPRPYIEPSIEEELPEIKRIIGQEVKASILIGIKEMFST